VEPPPLNLSRPSVNTTLDRRPGLTFQIRMDTKDLISVAEAAEIAGCSDKTICLKLRTGDLQGERIGDRIWVVSRSAAQRLATTISNRSRRKRAEAAALAARSRRSKRA